jgi:2-keto-4-pentenoate hydratase/2-oxohepta-3-ene-1,7-dioic acid hydratase in catechol pathway
MIEGEEVLDVSAALKQLPTSSYPFPSYDILYANFSSVIEAAKKIKNPDRKKLKEVSLLSPVANPGKLVAAPVNYIAHLEEAIKDQETWNSSQVKRIHEVGLFLKATSSLIGASECIQLAKPDRRTDHEVELAAVIGKTCKNVSASEALDYIAGYSIGLDITVRGPEERSLRKSCDTYSVLGPWLVTPDEFGSPTNQRLLLDVDGERRQDSNTSKLVMSVAELIEMASSFYTLQAGDVLYTGTPEGVGPIKRGNVINASIDGIGSMSIHVA